MKGRSPMLEDIYPSACIPSLEKQHCSHRNVSMATSRLSRGVRSYIYDGIRKAVCTAVIGTMLASTMVLPAHATDTTIAAGMNATGIVIGTGDNLHVYGTTDRMVSNGGGAYVYAGGQAYNSSLSAGFLEVRTGGWAEYTDLNASAKQLIDGGDVMSVILKDESYQQVDSGTAFAIFLNGRSKQKVNDGNVDSVRLYNSSRQMVYGGRVFIKYFKNNFFFRIRKLKQ